MFFTNRQTVLVFDEYKYYENGNMLNEDNGNELKIKQNEDLMTSRIEMMTSYNKLFSAAGINVFEWLKYRGYEEKEAKPYLNMDLQYNEETDPILARYFKEEKDYKEYSLVDALGLFTELAKINPFSFKSIKNFIKIFGLPCGVPDYSNAGIKLRDATPIPIQYVDYNMLVYKIIEYKLIFDIFKNIVTNDSDYILDRDSVILSKEYIFYEPTDKNTILQTESEYFTNILNSKNFLQPKVFHNPLNNNVFHLESTYLNLFDFAYYQMVNALINRSEFKECENCGHLFEVTHDKMRFCPTLPFRKRSSCEMAYRNKMRKN